MVNTSNKRNFFRAGERKAQMREALGSDKILYALDEDGDTVLEIPWALDYTPEQKAQIKRLDDGSDEIDFLRIVLTQEQFELFEAAEGDPEDLMLVIAECNQRVQDIREERPTR